MKTGLAKIGYIIAALWAGMAAQAQARPALWMGPPFFDCLSLRDLFSHPKQWAQARSHVDVLYVADHEIGNKCSDAELAAWMPQAARWGLKVALEVGAIKEWGPTAELAFSRERWSWDKIIRNGGSLYAVAMDEPLVAIRNPKINQNLEYAVNNVARFVALVRQNYPGTLVGDIEPYPGVHGDDLLRFWGAVNARLNSMGLAKMDFVRADVDWMHFVLHTKQGVRGWAGVHDLERGVHQLGMPFQLIYWAANIPSMRSKGLPTDTAWDPAIMQEGNDYRATGGKPDAYVVQSWISAPAREVPDSDPESFTYSVLDFATNVMGER